MKYLNLRSDERRALSFYLAMEEYAARSLWRGEDLFFMWRVGPTVICGRNQDIPHEVDLDYCRERGIDVFRRKSGGGCVYADMSNVMLSYITRGDDVKAAFDRYMDMLAEALNKVGVAAERNDHNDILVGGRKVSGNALSHADGMIIAHGTLLYDTDMENMSRAITPDNAKLSRNAVKSVSQRITFLKDFTDKPLGQIMAEIRASLCDGEATLSDSDERTIREIERQYPNQVQHPKQIQAP